MVLSWMGICIALSECRKGMKRMFPFPFEIRKNALTEKKGKVMVE
jgi:hypothetical protein